MDSWVARTRSDRVRTERGEEGEEDEVEAGKGTEDEWLSCPAFVEERVFVEHGRALTGREAWLSRARLVAAAEAERRRVLAAEQLQIAMEEETKQERKEAKKSRLRKAAEGGAVDAFFTASGIKRRR